MSFLLLIAEYVYHIAAIIIALVVIIGLVVAVFVYVVRITRETIMDVLLFVGVGGALVVFAILVHSYK